MQWLTFVIVAYVTLILEIGLRSLLAPSWNLGVYPQFTLILAVYVGLWAGAGSTRWALLLLGLATDLLWPVVGADSLSIATPVPGPAALGFLIGSMVVLHLRPVMMRSSAWALGVTVLVVGIFVHLVVVVLLSMRGIWSDPVAGWAAADQLATRFQQLLYTALAAVPLGWLLLKTHRLWGFESHRLPYARR